MAIFQTSTVTLMHQRLSYLSKRSQVLTENIARSDIPGALRQEVKPFREILSKKSLDASRNPITSTKLTLSIDNRDIQTQSTEIEREMEVMEMNHNVINHQSILDILSTMHKLYKSALSRHD